MICSRSWRALMRRNVIYRKKNWISSILEFGIPLFFVYLLMLIKQLVDDSSSFLPETIPAQFSSNEETFRFMTFGDYVTALQAERICVANEDEPGKFNITGIVSEAYNWQVPFVKCDFTQCETDLEDAQKYCEYPFLAVAPMESSDADGKTRAEAFKGYVEEAYPALTTSMPFDYDFVRFFESNDAIEDYVTQDDYGKAGLQKIGLAVIFSGNDPEDYIYSIRANSTNFNAQQNARPAMKTTPDTGLKFSSFAKSDFEICIPEDGTAEQGPLEFSCTGQYMYNGFLTVQRLVNDWIMVDSGAKDLGYFVSEHGVQYTVFPSKAYDVQGFYGEVIAGFMPLLMTLGLLYPCASMISYVVQEKELRQKELMKMMSVTESDIGWSWFFSFFWFHFITATMCSILATNVFVNSEGGFIFFFFHFSFMAFEVLCLLLASLNAKTTRSVLIGLLVIFSGYFLNLIVPMEDGEISQIGLISWHPISAFSYTIQEIARLEDLGVGVTADTAGTTENPSGFTYNLGTWYLIRDCIFLGVLTWYLNRVIVPDYGQALPWYFPFTSAYWCGGKVDTSEGEEDSGPKVPVEPVSSSLQQQAEDGENIEIKSLRKSFKDKTAVDGLNLSIYSGQITALLGHNGAGKTTTINMLTGAMAPTSGYAVIKGKDIRSQLTEIRSDIGICLQHDCLFPKLTVREHIQFFSRLKGLYAEMSASEAEEHITQVISDVALAEKTNTPSANLSGGMKRKLSVAMAFCGGSKVVFLDEPTSGMDPFSRRFTWNVIRQFRQGRCIILTTHFMDEADILGDRIAIMAEGQLRCCGSSLFLKRTYGVGYQLTIEKNSKGEAGEVEQEIDLDNPDQIIERNAESWLMDVVQGNVKDAKLLSNVGTELSFQLPIEASASFVPMLEELDLHKANGAISTYGVSITTLDEVFLLVARGASDKEEFKSSHFSTSKLLAEETEDKSVHSRMNLEKEGLLSTHLSALIRKRAANFKRDKKAWCCTTILPSLFVLMGFILLKFAGLTREYGALSLDLADYNADYTGDTPRNPIPFNDGSSFSCQPGIPSYQEPFVQVDATGEYYSFFGVETYMANGPSCSISEGAEIMQRMGSEEDDAVEIGLDGENVGELSLSIFNASSLYGATMYGGIHFTHDPTSMMEGSNLTYGEAAKQKCLDAISIGIDYTSEAVCDKYLGMGYVVAYNFTALHVAPLYQALADEAIVRTALQNNNFKISATIHPLPITSSENTFLGADDAFSLWFLVVLSFPFIAGAFATFIVTERITKAKHLQTVAGIEPIAYWVSSFLWDTLNYQIPLWVTVILMFIFDVEIMTTTSRNVLGGVLVLLFLYGPASASFSYVISFMFKSPSLCNLVIIISGFLIGMGGPITCFVLRIIGNDVANPKDNLITIANVIEGFGRFLPSFCLGKGLFNVINIESFEFWGEGSVSAWDSEILLWEVIFLFLESIGYLGLAVYLDVLIANPEAMVGVNKIFTVLFLSGGASSESVVTDTPDDDDVLAEKKRIADGEANEDNIVISELTKIYGNGKLAVNSLSLGIPRGECFGLLGINGAGKTTTMGMLTAEFPPTSGDATLAGFSVRREPKKIRRRIGYCPQFDAHFENMTGREHVELYAAIKGIPTESVKAAAASKLAEVGLKPEDCDRLSANYSGGMKRRLSLACATIGQPEIVFLDECSTGVDPVARREIWQMVSDLVSDTSVPENERTSVILTTHSMDECEALCPRIGIMANGKLRCVGSAQHLKSKFGRGFQLEMKVNTVSEEDEDYKQNREKLAGSAEKLHFNLAETKAALEAVTGDDSLSKKVDMYDETGYLVYKDATSEAGVELHDLASFVTVESRIVALNAFVTGTYEDSVLRERQDLKCRYEVSSEKTSIAKIFASIEENKVDLQLADYGVSQTSLEQVFNMHAAEAEKLKHGRNDR